MKNEKTTILIIAHFFLLACNNHNVVEEEVIPVEPTKVSLNNEIKQRVNELVLFFDYTSNKEWRLSNEQLRSLAKWVEKIENDSILNQIDLEEFEKHFVVHIQAGMFKGLTPETAKKRMGDIKDKVTTMLGIHADYNMEVFKVLTNLKYKEKHDIEITINRLMY